VYFKLVQWALKFRFHIEVDTTWEGTDGSAYFLIRGCEETNR